MALVHRISSVCERSKGVDSQVLLCSHSWLQIPPLTCLLHLLEHLANLRGICSFTRLHVPFLPFFFRFIHLSRLLTAVSAKCMIRLLHAFTANAPCSSSITHATPYKTAANIENATRQLSANQPNQPLFAPLQHCDRYRFLSMVFSTSLS